MLIEIPELDQFSTLEPPDRLPQKPGLYAIIGRHEELFYIGSGWDIRDSWHHLPRQFRKQQDRIHEIKYWLAPPGTRGATLLAMAMLLSGVYEPLWIRRMSKGR